MSLFTFSAASNEVIEKGQPKPASEDYDLNTQRDIDKYWRHVSKCTNEQSKLTRYPVSGPHKWYDGQEVREGVDFYVWWLAKPPVAVLITQESEEELPKAHLETLQRLIAVGEQAIDYGGCLWESVPEDRCEDRTSWETMEDYAGHFYYALSEITDDLKRLRQSFTLTRKP